MILRRAFNQLSDGNRYQCLKVHRYFHTGIKLLYRQNYYETLGVPRNASEKDVKKAYIQLAKKFHPDANPGNKEAVKKFTEIAEAYSVLSNKQQRAAFDGESSGRGNSGSGADFDPLRRSTTSYGSVYEGFHSTVNPEELFRKIFGSDFNPDLMRGSSKRVWVDYAPRHDADTKMEDTIVSLTFREAACGCDKVIRANTLTTCEKCMGLGAEPGKAIQICPFCEGLGYEIIDGIHGKVQASCRFCHGKGHNVVHKCSNCLGFGKTLVKRDVIVPIPAGIVDGETIKLNISPGDDDQGLGTTEIQQVYITFRVKESEYFRVDELNAIDLHSEASISLSQAIFGGKIKVDGLYQDEDIKLEPGIDSHTVIKLSTKGLKQIHQEGYGDHYVHLKIKIPKKLSSEQAQLLKKYAQLETDTIGEINGIDMSKKPKKEMKIDETDLDHEYASIDPDISDQARRDVRTNLPNAWQKMLVEAFKDPAEMFVQKIIVFYREIFRRS